MHFPSYDPTNLTCGIPTGVKLPSELSCNKGRITDISNNPYIINFSSCYNNNMINTGTYADKSTQQVMCYDPKCGIPIGVKLPSDLSCNKGIITDASNNKYNIDITCFNNNNTNVLIHKPSRMIMCYNPTSTCYVPPSVKLPSDLSCNKGIITDASNNPYIIDLSCHIYRDNVTAFSHNPTKSIRCVQNNKVFQLV